jgi:hypothetical protein
MNIFRCIYALSLIAYCFIVIDIFCYQDNF